MNISELRKNTGLSQSKFAEKFHLSLKTLQRWERGQTSIPESILFLLNENISMANKLSFTEGIFMNKSYLKNVLEEDKGFVVNALCLLSLEDDEEEKDEDLFLSFCGELRKE